MELINKDDVEFIASVFRKRHYHFCGDATMKSMKEIPSVQGLPDPYPWLESCDDVPLDSLLSWDDVQKIMCGYSVIALAPQSYTEIVVLTHDHEMIQQLFYNDANNMAIPGTNVVITGTGCDCWLKPTESLAKYFRSMI